MKVATWHVCGAQRKKDVWLKPFTTSALEAANAGSTNIEISQVNFFFNPSKSTTRASLFMHNCQN